MRTHNQMNDIFQKCKKELDALDIKYGYIKELHVIHMPANKYGATSHLNTEHGKEYIIEVSDVFTDERVPVDTVRGIMFHEIIHTVQGCNGHTGDWGTIAKVVHTAYPECPISIEDGRGEKRGIPDEVYRDIQYKGKAKFVVRCQKCGEPIFRTKKTNFIEHPEMYRCSCGGQFGKAEELSF